MSTEHSNYALGDCDQDRLDRMIKAAEEQWRAGDGWGRANPTPRFVDVERLAKTMGGVTWQVERSVEFRFLMQIGEFKASPVFQ